MADIKSLIGGNGPGTVSDLHNDIPDSAWSGHVFYFDPADAAHAATAAADYFVYNDNGAGNNVITDFTVGFAAGHDVVIFSHSVFADWAHLLAASTQVGADTVITVDPANSITLTGVSLTALAADDFKFV